LGCHGNVCEDERHDRFFRARAGAAEREDAARTDNWLQRWIAIAQTMGIGKRELMEDYYYDEFMIMLDEYNDLHKAPDQGEDEIQEVYADNW
jgi:hypothetical protein